jgi:hypothetical protein
MGRRRFDLDGRVLIIFVIVAVPFVAIAASIVIGMVRSSLRETLGTTLQQRAVETKVFLERYLSDRIVHARLLTLDPQVQAAVARPARDPKPDEIKKLEQAWTSGQDPQTASLLLSSPLAARLREHVAVQPAVKLLQVVDSSGRLVASSARSGRVVQAESAWYRALSSDGVRGEYIGDIHRPQGSDKAFLEIAYPIRAPEGHWQGAVRALVDASDLYSVLAPIRVGRTGHGLLVRREDGMILGSDDAHAVLTEVFPGHEVLQATRPERGYWVLPELKIKTPQGQLRAHPSRIAAYAEVDLGANIAWLAVIQQDVDEAMKPVADVTRYLWFHFAAAFSSFVALALYLSFKLKRPVIEEELHLHEEHVPKSMRRRRSDRGTEDEEAPPA